MRVSTSAFPELKLAYIFLIYLLKKNSEERKTEFIPIL